jgi:hypothetical protein
VECHSHRLRAFDFQIGSVSKSKRTRSRLQWPGHREGLPCIADGLWRLSG